MRLQALRKRKWRRGLTKRRLDVGFAALHRVLRKKRQAKGTTGKPVGVKKSRFEVLTRSESDVECAAPHDEMSGARIEGSAARNDL